MSVKTYITKKNPKIEIIHIFTVSTSHIYIARNNLIIKVTTVATQNAKTNHYDWFSSTSLSLQTNSCFRYNTAN